MASTYENLRDRLASPIIGEDAFAMVADLAAFAAVNEDQNQVLDLIIRSLDRRDQLQSETEILYVLARQHGLFPYIVDEAGIASSSELPFPDAIAMEMHRPDGMDGVFFHRVQNSVYQRLTQGENVILSAPTSFGKSLIVDSLISTGRYRSIALVVPTIALIDETRRRLRKFVEYKIITHPGQTFQERNLLVLTQERLLAMETLPQIDLFFLDEFYKLAEPRGQGKDKDDPVDGRAVLLNIAFQRLLKTGAQFYLAGPNIRGLVEQLPPNIQAAFFHTDYSTVATDTIRVQASADEQRQKLLEIVSGSSEPTLIYCQSPARARRVVEWLLAGRETPYASGMATTSQWIRDNYHSDWLLPRALERGIGVHHGRLPRWLAQLVVDGFNSEDLGILVCTNSLIEGVNTRAKNMIILDPNIARDPYGYFTFANIRGRAGRMLKHFIGKVYLFHDSPAPTLPDIDIPILTQSPQAPNSLLLAVDEDEQTRETQRRLEPIKSQSAVSLETLKANVGIAPEIQIALAEHLDSLSRRSLSELVWNTPYPTYEQVGRIVELIWQWLPQAGQTSHGPVSASQLALYLSRAGQADGNMRQIIIALVGDPKHWRPKEDLDSRVDSAFDFMRFWVEHGLPARIRALDRILREVLQRRNLEPGSYLPYAARVEAGFMPPHFLSMEEFGLPVEITRKLSRRLGNPESLDEMIAAIKRAASASDSQLNALTAYERLLLRRAADSL